MHKYLRCRMRMCMRFKCEPGINDIANLQRKAIQIIGFKNKYTPAEPLFKETKIIILNEMIKSNCLLALHHINQCLPLSLKNLLTNENDLHNGSTQN